MPQSVLLAVIAVGLVLVTFGAVLHVAAIGVLSIFGDRPTGALSMLLDIAPWLAATSATMLFWCAVLRSDRTRVAFVAWVGAISLTLVAVALGPGTTPNAGAQLAVAVLSVMVVGWAVENRLRARPNVRRS